MLANGERERERERSKLRIQHTGFNHVTTMGKERCVSIMIFKSVL